MALTGCYLASFSEDFDAFATSAFHSFVIAGRRISLRTSAMSRPWNAATTRAFSTISLDRRTDTLLLAMTVLTGTSDLWATL